MSLALDVDVPRAPQARRLCRSLRRREPPQPQHKDRADRCHEQIAEPAFELEIHQLRQPTADKRARDANQKIGEETMIASGYFFGNPTRNDANDQHAKEADTGRRKLVFHRSPH